ncbi:MAG: hypothetical protein IJN44_04145 [Clostridia bacterium]|nr:hypothetical protein [Clostridia bacterium]
MNNGIQVNEAVSNKQEKMQIITAQFYGWIFGLKNMVKIESPQSVVDGMKEMLSAVGKRYEDPKGLQ